MEIILNILLVLLIITGIAIGGTIYVCSGMIAEEIVDWLERKNKYD